jgi:hypothetical protein
MEKKRARHLKRMMIKVRIRRETKTMMVKMKMTMKPQIMKIDFNSFR